MDTVKLFLKTLSVSVVFLFGCAETSVPSPSPTPSSAPHSAEEIIRQYTEEGKGYFIGNAFGDEKEELLIGTIGNGVFQSYITHVFQLGDGDPVSLFSGSDKDRIYLLDREELLEEKSDSEFSSSWNVLGVNNTDLVFREGIVYDETLSSDYPWFSAADNGKAGSSISSEEFVNHMIDYEGRIQNPCLISFSKTLSDTFALNNRPVERMMLSVQRISTVNTEITDPLVIKATLNAMKTIKIGDKSTDGTTDSDDVITFYFEDGSSVNVRFRRGKLAYGPKDECYLLDGAETLFTILEKYSGYSMQ